MSDVTLRHETARRPAGVDIAELARAFDLPASIVFSFLRRIGIRHRRHFEKRLLTDPDARHVRRELRRWLRVPWSVRCRECGRRFRGLTSFHLGRHGLTCVEYREAHRTFLRSFDMNERFREILRGHPSPRAFRWTAEKVELLRRQHGRRRVKDLSLLLGANASAIRRKARQLSLPVPRWPRWKAHEDAMVRRLVGNVSEEEIAQRIARSPESVRRHALGARIRPRLVESRPWTGREDALLRRSYGRIPTRDLADRMGRSTQALQSRSSRLGGLKLGRKPPRWSRAEDEALTRWAGVLPTPEIAKRIGRSVIALAPRARKLGLSLRRELLWTRRDEARLPRLVERIGIDGTARLLGRTRRAIEKRLARLGFARYRNGLRKEAARVSRRSRGGRS